MSTTNHKKFIILQSKLLVKPFTNISENECKNRSGNNVVKMWLIIVICKFPLFIGDPGLERRFII